MAERIRNDFIDILTTGKSYKEISTALSNDLGIRFHQAQRLIRTEMARVAIQSTLNSYAAAGVKYVKIITAHDDNVCSPECEKHAGRKVPINQAKIGVVDDLELGIPPFHPNCRCDIVAVWEDSNV